MLGPEREVETEEALNENPMYDYRDHSICYSPSPEACYINYNSPGGHMDLSPEIGPLLWDYPDGNAIPSTQPHVRSASPLSSRERQADFKCKIILIKKQVLQHRTSQHQLLQHQKIISKQLLQHQEIIKKQHQEIIFQEIIKKQHQGLLQHLENIKKQLLQHQELLKQLLQHEELLQHQEISKKQLLQHQELLQLLQHQEISKKQLLQIIKKQLLPHLLQHQEISKKQLLQHQELLQHLELLQHQHQEIIKKQLLQHEELLQHQEIIKKQLLQHQEIRLQELKKLNRLKFVLCCLLNQNKKVREVKKLNLLKFEHKVLKQLKQFVLVQELDRLQNENRDLHKFIQHAPQITLQITINMTHEICEEGHDNSSIEILDKMIVVADTLKFHLSWTKAPCRHHNLANGGDLKKSCTGFDGCYMHQDCLSTAKLEIYVEYHIERCQRALSSHSKPHLVHYASKIELQRIYTLCEPIASADDQPNSRCELSHILRSTKSPPGPNGLPDGEERLQQDSLNHQLAGNIHAMNDGENVLGEGGIPNAAFSYPENEETEGKLEEVETHAMNDEL